MLEYVQRMKKHRQTKKRLALQALHIRVIVNGGAAKLYGATPTNLATTAQTSGYHLIWTKNYSTKEGSSVRITA